MHPMLNVAVKAARRAGTVIQRASLDLDRIRVERKQHNDFVSEVDRVSEETIIQTILEAYPKHAILAEESGVHGVGYSEYEWIIDPLDGTTNFLHGHPQYSISIGLAYKGQIQQAVVFDPNRNDLFTASRGIGAFLNNRRIRVSRHFALNECVISTGFPVCDLTRFGAYMETLKDVIAKTAGIRREGSAALDLCNVACGRTDGFWEFGLKSWDIAAGSLLVQEAGGLVTDLIGEQSWLTSGDIVAANSKVLAQLLSILASHLG